MLFIHLWGEETTVRIPAQGCICVNNIYCVRGELQLPQALRRYHRLPQVPLTGVVFTCNLERGSISWTLSLGARLASSLGEKEQ